ncbi:MAG: efflux RND transporter permease subunit, partial [Candidatus Margulisbacteria bacterium]|nr:efflux RND transporter permease subunit [Candidatus Margulisiibacteriota bacterium]
MIAFFIRRPLFTLAIFAVVLILGVFSLTRLPLDFLPNIEIPTLTIITPYPGASAEDIEITVSKVIEDGIATVPNIDKIVSDSQENYSIVTISFKWGTNLDAASADVRDKMDQVRSKLPNDIQPSTIYKFDTSQIPVLTFGISSDKSYSRLYEIGDKTISPALKRIQGVGTVIVSGGLKRQINVEVDRQRLEAYHLSISRVIGALQAANLSIPAGSLKSGALDYSIRIPGEFTSVAQIGRTIVGSYNNRDIFVSDVADVKDDFKEQDNLTEVNKKPGVTLMVQKQSGSNTVQVVSAIRQALEKLKPDLPPDVEITIVSDTSEWIVRQITELSTTLMWAFFFVALTVLFFLRNLRGSFIIAMAIPFSILAAFIYMFFGGASINIISLASIIISIGVVVDDAIVVLENIERHNEHGEKDAAVAGASEVFGAVLASTITNAIIFVPLLLIQGFMGIFFGQLSVITIVVISMSFFTAMMLTPMLCDKLLVGRVIKQNNHRWITAFHDRSEALFVAVENSYKQLLAWAIGNKRKVIGGLALFFFLSLALFRFTGTEFFPEQDTGQIQATLEMPAGTRWDETAAAMKQIEARLLEKIPEIQYIMIRAGISGGLSFGSQSGPNIGTLNIKVVPLSQRKRGLRELERVVAAEVYATPGVKSINFGSMGANALAGGGKPVTIEIYGSDFNFIDQVTDRLYKEVVGVRGVVDPSISREKANPEYAFNIDREKAAALGLSVYEIAMAARSSLYGTTATKYREGGDEYDVFVRLKQEGRKSLEDIKNIYVTNRTGSNITLGNIASVALSRGPQVIERKNQQRIVMIQADYFGRAFGDVIADVRRIVRNTPLPADVTIKIAGSAEQINESFRSLTISLLLGLILIYLVMVAQFESLMDPFIIMFAVPFALAGVVWALFLTGAPFGVMAFIGLILVTGVAVKNTIVLVDYTNILRHRGIALREAVLEAGRVRLRPILMTSSTTILGLVPI